LFYKGIIYSATASRLKHQNATIKITTIQTYPSGLKTIRNVEREASGSSQGCNKN
jgi:hypothetical protein